MKNLVLFWGWTRNEKSYQGLIESAPKDWKIFTVSYEELIPKGKIEDFHNNILQFLKANSLKRFYLLGHSLGGSLALEFTYHHPEMLERLFLVDSEGIYGHESLPQVMKNFLKTHTLQGKKKAGENLKAIYRILRRPILHLKLAHFAHHADVQQEAKSIKVPTTILWGEKDHLTPLWQGERLHHLITTSNFIILAGQGHDWILYQPELFWQNI